MSATAETTAADQRVTSHKGRRQSRNKKSDPFLELSDDALKFPDQPSPSKDEDGSFHHSESLIADLVLTPINVISFVLGLILVERDSRKWRLSQHAPARETSFWRQFGHASPEPYQEADGTTWHPRLSWRRRGVAKAQIESVFDMRGRVILALAAWTLLGFAVIGYSIHRMYIWAFL